MAHLSRENRARYIPWNRSKLFLCGFSRRGRNALQYRRFHRCHVPVHGINMQIIAFKLRTCFPSHRSRHAFHFWPTDSGRRRRVVVVCRKHKRALCERERERERQTRQRRLLNRWMLTLYSDRSLVCFLSTLLLDLLPPVFA